MKLGQLLTTRRDAQSAGQPVLTIASENDGGAEALAAISAVTGGASYQTSDPAGSATCSPMRWGHAPAGRAHEAPPAADWFSASHHSDTTTPAHSGRYPQASSPLAGGGDTPRERSDHVGCPVWTGIRSSDTRSYCFMVR